jgi:NAD-dependent DNA ligase
MKRIVELGGTSSDSMKADTTILIAKDPGSGSAKLQKAIDKGIPVMSIAEFKSKYKLE